MRSRNWKVLYTFRCRRKHQLQLEDDVAEAIVGAPCRTCTAPLFLAWIDYR